MAKSNHGGPEKMFVRDFHPIEIELLSRVAAVYGRVRQQVLDGCGSYYPLPADFDGLASHDHRRVRIYAQWERGSIEFRLRIYSDRTSHWSLAWFANCRCHTCGDRSIFCVADGTELPTTGMATIQRLLSKCTSMDRELVR